MRPAVRGRPLRRPVLRRLLPEAISAAVLVTVLAYDPNRRTNARAVVDLVSLGRLKASDSILDSTYGLGRFWRDWRPVDLVAVDLDPAKAPDGVADFTAPQFPDRSFDVVVLDPPYGLRGTSRLAMDAGYGLGSYRSPSEVAALIRVGVAECARVAGRAVLVKVMDQIAGGSQHWQTVAVHAQAAELGLDVVEELHVTAPVRQPLGRRQVHAHGRPSTLLVLEHRRRSA